MTKTFWITYDLGLKGDYAGLYTWLDTVGAKECGDSIAVFTKEYEGELVEAVKTEMLNFMTLGKTDRIYLIHLDNQTGKVKGNFVFGGRKRAAWEGYATGIHTAEEDFAQ